MLEDQDVLDAAADACKPDVIVHLAAQAGVRYSLEAPRAYIDANVVGTFNVMEAARRHEVRHLLMASTSSVYGAETEMPYRETQKADTQMTIYAATKKACEAMGHSYAHLWNLPTTMFRFFTVYGPWGRPDMALYKFVDAILEDRPIDVYNHGEMYRDFTYVEDLVRGIRLLIDAAPVRPESPEDIAEGDSLSPVAPYRVVNIGNSQTVRLLDFVDAIEEALGKKAQRNLMEMQKGDVPATWGRCEPVAEPDGLSPRNGCARGDRAVRGVVPGVLREVGGAGRLILCRPRVSFRLIEGSEIFTWRPCACPLFPVFFSPFAPPRPRGFPLIDSSEETHASVCIGSSDTAERLIEIWRHRPFRVGPYLRRACQDGGIAGHRLLRNRPAGGGAGGFRGDAGARPGRGQGHPRAWLGAS